MKRAPGEKAVDFDLVLKLSVEGRIEEALVRPETKLAVCFREETKPEKYPPPPSAGFWFVLGVRFSGK